MTGRQPQLVLPNLGKHWQEDKNLSRLRKGNCLITTAFSKFVLVVHWKEKETFRNNIVKIGAVLKHLFWRWDIPVFNFSLSAALIRNIILLLIHLTVLNFIEIYVLIKITRFQTQNIFHLQRSSTSKWRKRRLSGVVAWIHQGEIMPDQSDSFLRWHDWLGRWRESRRCCLPWLQQGFRHSLP